MPEAQGLLVLKREALREWAGPGGKLGLTSVRAAEEKTVCPPKPCPKPGPATGVDGSPVAQCSERSPQGNLANIVMALAMALPGFV